MAQAADECSDAPDRPRPLRIDVALFRQGHRAERLGVVGVAWIDQEIARLDAAGRRIWEPLPMGLTHCPLCIGVAVLSAVRFMAHATMLIQLERGRASTSTHPAMVLGTVFEL